MSNKTIIACRPGMKVAMQAAFAGMEVVVDDNLTKDYEFREREMDLAEIMEEELSKEERQDADPKNALTFVVPLVMSTDDVADNPWTIPYLAVRIENSASNGAVLTSVKKFKPTPTGVFPDFEVNVSASIGALKAHLKGDGFNVLSISQADGLTATAEV